MAEFDFDLRDIYRIIRRRRWVLILVPILAALLTYLISTTPPSDYQAESLVKISRVAANMQALLIETLSWYQGDNIATQSQIITSRKIRARVAMRLAEKYPEFGEASVLLGELEEDNYDGIEQEIRNSPRLAELIDRVNVAAERKGDSDVVGIMAMTTSATLAIDMVNHTVQEFINFNVSERNSEIREAVRFIQARIRETEQELSGDEGELERFKREHAEIVGLDLSDTESLHEQIDRLGREVVSLEGAIGQLEEVNSADQYVAFSPALSEAQDSVISRLEQQLLGLIEQTNEVKSERRRLLAYHTEQSKEVQQNAERTEEMGRRVEEIIATVLQRYRAIRDHLVQNQGALIGRRDRLASVPEVTRRLEAYERQVSLKTEALNLLQRRLQDAEIQQASEIREVTVVEQSSFASELPQPSRLFKAMLGLLIGIILGGVFAVVLESLDTSIGTIEDVERYLEMPVVGVIPHLDRELVRENMLRDEMGAEVTDADVHYMATLATHFTPSEPVSEAFRSVRAHLEVLLKRKSWKTILFTSSVLQEGKTNTVCNLGTVFAQAGNRTLLSRFAAAPVEQGLWPVQFSRAF